MLRLIVVLILFGAGMMGAKSGRAGTGAHPKMIEPLMGTCSEGFWGLFNNPASMTAVQGWCTGFGGRNHYLVRGLGRQWAGVLLGKNGRTAGLSLVTDGFNKYRTTDVKLSGGIKVGKHVRAGVSLGLRHNINTETPQRGVSLLPAAGVALRLARDVGLSVVLHDPYQFVFNGKVLPSSAAGFDTGICWKVGEEVLLYIEMNKQQQQRPAVTAGLGFYQGPRCFTFISVRVKPFTPQLYFQLQYKQLHLLFAVSWHPSLGTSPETGFYFSSELVRK